MSVAYEYKFEPCDLDGRCVYARGHQCECSTVEIAKHVTRLREEAARAAVRTARAASRAGAWKETLDWLVEDGRSPLVEVGWSVKERGELWHQDRTCRGLDGRVSRLVASLWFEAVASGKRACGKCVDWSEETWQRARLDTARTRLEVGLASGGCVGKTSTCPAPAGEGLTVCRDHLEDVSKRCLGAGDAGPHLDCDGKAGPELKRDDDSTYRRFCTCVCHRRGAWG